MEEQKKYLKELIANSNFAIEKYHEASFSDYHTPFIGTPQKHPYDKTKVLLIPDPFNSEDKYYEFPIQAVDFIEELETITSNTGKTALKVKLWVKKGSMAIESKPFIIE